MRAGRSLRPGRREASGFRPYDQAAAPSADHAEGSTALKDADCVALLQWALPHLGLHWPGFRKVRRQVCRRVAGRMRELGLADPAAYRERLERDPSEWQVLDGLCPITVSRFCRDRGLWEHLAAHELPRLAEGALARGAGALRCWSAGAASGEEPYTLAIAWRQEVAPRFPGLDLDVLASDVGRAVLARARAAIYGAGSLKDLPPAWRAAAFSATEGRFRLEPRFRAGVRFLRQDIRTRMPRGPFDLVLCRNLVFTYFDRDHRRALLGRMAARLAPGAILVIGKHERLPENAPGIVPAAADLGIHCKPMPAA